MCVFIYIYIYIYVYHKETKFLLFEVETYRTYSHEILGCYDMIMMYNRY